MTVYIDTEYVCHVNDGNDYRAVEVVALDGKCPRYIENCRFIPLEEVWTREDGKQFTGEILTTITEYEILVPYQAQYEEDLNNMMILNDVADLVELVYEDDLGIIG